MKPKRNRTMTVRSTLFTVTMALLLSSAASTAENQLRSDDKFRIGILYEDDDVGINFRDEIIETISHHGLAPQIETVARSYINTEDGMNKLLSLTASEQKVDLMLGPTDSEVYLAAIARRDEVEKHQVPIVSSAVIADVPFKPKGWFFKTNVDVKKRVEVIYDYLNKMGFPSVAILYENTDWGIRAEEHFNQLNDEEDRNYSKYLYDPVSNPLRTDLGEIVRMRPAVVGVLGNRGAIRSVHELMQRMQSGIPYHPIFFSIIDVRYSSAKMNDILMVSLAGVNGPNESIQDTRNDIKLLARDTTLVVLDDLEKVLTPTSNIEVIKTSFRDRFEARYQSSTTSSASLSDMEFLNFANQDSPEVLHLLDDRLTKLPETDEVSFWAKAKFRFELEERRFGFLPAANLILILVSALIFSIRELKKWNSIKIFRVFYKTEFILYVFLACAFPLAIFISLAESGLIEYGNVFVALAIAGAPLALAKTFPASGSLSVIIDTYDRLMLWVNDRLMVYRYWDNEKVINLVAYHNSVDNMKTCLKGFYQKQRDEERRKVLLEELDNIVTADIPYVERRKACAKLLLRLEEFKTLQVNCRAPRGTFRDLRDPEKVIMIAARYCAKDKERREKVDDTLDLLLDREPPERKAQLEEALQRDLQGVEGGQGILERKIAFLFVLEGYSELFLYGLGLLPNDYKERLTGKVTKTQSIETEGDEKKVDHPPVSKEGRKKKTSPNLLQRIIAKAKKKVTKVAEAQSQT